MIAYDHDLVVLARQMRSRVYADFFRRTVVRLARRAQAPLDQGQTA